MELPPFKAHNNRGWKVVRKAVLCLLLILGPAFVASAQASQATADETLQLEQQKFEFEKRESTRALILGFLLTTVGGAYITWLLSTRSWSRQTRIDLYRKRFDEGTAFLDEFSRAVGRRFFLMQRFLWAIDSLDSHQVQTKEREYFESVLTWNASYWVYRNKIRLLIDDAQANAFLDYQDDFRLENPESLHYMFVKAHRDVLKAKDDPVLKTEAQMSVDNLNWACSSFLENLTTLFLNRTISLQLLRPQPMHESTLKSGIGKRAGLRIPPRLWQASLTSSKPLVQRDKDH
jgi:hypothetical protein